jgi:hypothetical protein
VSQRLIFMVSVAVCVTVAVSMIAKYTSEYNIEEIKQESFMMKACVDAGGEWSKSWNRVPSCLRSGHS